MRIPIEETLYRIYDAIVENGNKAASLEEIARLAELPVNYMGPVLAHLRKNCQMYGWTIPAGKRGRTTGDLKFYIVLVGSDGVLELDPTDPERLTALRLGARGTLSHATSSMRNQANAIEAVCAYLPPDSHLRGKLQEIVDDIKYLSRKTAALVPEFNEAMTA